MSQLVWYAAFGSNLLEERFLTYLQGGVVPRSGRQQHGARNPDDPVDNRPFRIARPLSFGFVSAGWEDKGVAFVECVPIDPPSTLGRAWLITDEQLADVWAQENGRQVGPEIDFDRLAVDGSADLGAGWYRRLEYLGELDGRPVATITCEEPPEPNPAGPAYLAVLSEGLVETWGISAAEAAEYLTERNGGVRP